MEMSVDGVVAPVGQLLLDILDGFLRLQTERIAAHINRLPPALVVREIEFLPELGERVLPVEPGREFAIVFENNHQGAGMMVPHLSQVRFCTDV